MFELSEHQALWAIVSYKADGDVIILHESNDATKLDLFYEGMFGHDNALDEGWTANAAKGIYRLDLVPNYDGDEDDRYIESIGVRRATLMMEFPNSEE